MGRRLVRAASLAAIGLAIPGVALAHPLGNFTINHYAGITVARDEIRLDFVIDMAEIPAFQERQQIDVDGDGHITDAETAAAAPRACGDAAAALVVSVDGSPATLATDASTLTFPPGLGGLSTMRLECTLAARLPTTISDRTVVTFEDRSYPDRIGWREIVAVGEGVAVTTSGLPATSPSQRLTSYPADLLSQPLDIRSARLVATPAPIATSTGPPANAPGVAPGGVVPGGIGGDLPDIFRAVDLTLFVIILSIVTALGLGVAHALTPGHGKTLMAAYLVGTRGTPAHAVGLGLAVTVSHTLGILVLAALVVGAQGILPPDVVVRAAPIIAAITIAVIGAWMLAAEVRRRVRARAAATEAGHAGHDPDHALHGEDHDRHREDDHPHVHEAPVHSHGGVPHSHVPTAAGTLSWRGLFALGLAGGLIPSTSALFILLGSIVAGRPTFGFVLVVVFGLGMALVMTTVGLTMVFARGRLDRMPSSSRLGRIARQAPLVAAAVVLGFGLYLTAQALGGRPVL